MEIVNVQEESLYCVRMMEERKMELQRTGRTNLCISLRIIWVFTFWIRANEALAPSSLVRK
jgi:hypothetical protein